MSSLHRLSAVLTSVKQPVSHEWIYRYVAVDKRNGGKLYRHLRQGHKRYRRGRNDKGPTILNAMSIDERPEVVKERTRLGDWEIDTVLGSKELMLWSLFWSEKHASILSKKPHQNQRKMLHRQR